MNTRLVKCPFCENGQVYISPTFVPDGTDGSDWTGFPLNINGTYEGGGYQTCSYCSGTGLVEPLIVPVQLRPPEVREAYRIKEAYKSNFLRIYPYPSPPGKYKAPNKPASLSELILVVTFTLFVAFLIEALADTRHNLQFFIYIGCAILVCFEIWQYLRVTSTYTRDRAEWQVNEAIYQKRLVEYKETLATWQQKLDEHLSRFPKDTQSIIDNWENPT